MSQFAFLQGEWAAVFESAGRAGWALCSAQTDELVRVLGRHTCHGGCRVTAVAAVCAGS